MELAKQKEAIRVDTHTYNPQRASRVYPVYFYKIILKRWGLNSIPSPPIFIYIYIANEFIHNCPTSVEMCNFIECEFYVFVEKARIGSNRNSIFSRVNECVSFPRQLF